MATLTYPVHFISGGKTYEVKSGEGFERCSAPWRFELIFHEPSGEEVDLAKLLKDPAELVWKAPVSGGASASYRTAHFRGVLAAAHTTEDGHYQVTLAPRLWKLSLQKNTRIFMEKTVQEILEEILKEHGFGTNEYAINCAKGPKREFVVQYQESDLDFIDRWLQHEGVGYYFKETDDAEQVVFFDSTASYIPVPGVAEVSAGAFKDDASKLAIDGWGGDQLVFNFAMDINMLPAKVVMKDYNWRKPSEDLKVEEKVPGDGAGIVYIYGDHFKDTSEGKALAKVRVEELTCREKIGRGYSTHKSFRPGHTFKLKEHEKKALNAEYLLTEVEHRLSQDVGEGRTGTLYANRFRCIPSSATFRPERATTWPRVSVFMHGKVDAGGDGKYAEIDDMGRYKVQLPFDLSGKAGGKASRYVRMMQPYAGGGMGMHFPLHMGTEVLLAFLDGDPDRPIIIGAVPNPETASPVTGGNQTQCKIHTGGGNGIQLEDTDGSQQVRIYSPTQNTFLSMGAENPPGHVHLGTGGNFAQDTGGNACTNTTGNDTHNTDGNTFWTTKGLKSEKILGAKETLIVGPNTEQDLAAKSVTIVGVKHETVFGLIAQIGYAARIDKQAGPHLFKNASQSTNVKAIYSLKAGAAANTKAPLINFNGSSKFFAKSGGSSLLLNPGGATIKAPKIVAQASGQALVKGATVNIKGNSQVTAKASTVTCQGSGTLNLKGGAVKVKGPTTVDGTLTVNKASTFKGNLSVKGTTFKVS